MDHLELLGYKSTADLLNLLEQKKLGFPIAADETDKRKILRMYNDKDDFEVSWHLRLLDEEEPDWSEYSEMSAEDIRLLKEHHKDRLKLAQMIRSIEEKRDEMCTKLSSVILGTEDMAREYDLFPDECINLMREACAMLKSGEESAILDVDLKADEKRGPDLLEEEGYCSCERVHAYDSDDEYEHIRTITFPAEILEVFQKIDSPANDRNRRLKRTVSDICSLAASYYDEATMTMAYRIYKKWMSEETEQPKITSEEFAGIAQDIASKMGTYDLYEYDGKFGILSYSFPDDDREQAESVRNRLRELETEEGNFYIPSVDEGREFLKYGYWPSRSGFSGLKQFLTEYYLDEQTMQNSGASMFMMIDQDENEMRRRFMSLDDVDEEVEKEMSEIAFQLRIGCDIEEIIDEHQHILLSVTEEAGNRFRELLKECDEQIPRPWL